MKTREEIEYEIRKLAVVADINSPVPSAVRETARNVCHTLSWVLNDDVLINPYNIIAGCCCVQPSPLPNDLGHSCSIGPDMCLQPSGDMVPSPLPLSGRRFMWVEIQP